MKPIALLAVLVCAAPSFLLGAEDYDWAQACTELQSGKSHLLVLPPGRHDLPPGGLKLSGLRDIMIEGNGATLLARERRTCALQIEGCSSVSIRNLQIDYDPLPFTQGEITSVDPKAHQAELRLHDGYPDEKAAESRPGSFSDARFQLFAADQPVLKPGAPDYSVQSLSRTGERTVRITFPEWQAGLEVIKPGDRASLSSRVAEGVSIRDSRDISLEKVSILAAPNVAIVVRSCENAGTFRQVRVVPGPPPSGASQPRLISACADGLNVAYARQGPVVEDCEFAYQADDAINLHGAMFPVMKWIDRKTFLTVVPWRRNRLDVIAQPGDEIRFLRAPAYQNAGSAKIEKIELGDEPAEPWLSRLSEIWSMLKIDPQSVTSYRVTLQSEVTGLEEGLFAEVPATAAAGFVIRRNSFHDHRARGLRLMTGDGLVLNNRFTRIKGAAISLGAEFDFWREAGWVRNVVISGNEIRDVGQGAAMLAAENYTMGAISIMARTGQGATSPFPGNENILLQNNLIDGCPVNGISVSNARAVQISGNTLRHLNTAQSTVAGSAYGLSSLESISIIRAEATLSDNHLPSPAQP